MADVEGVRRLPGNALTFLLLLLDDLATFAVFPPDFLPGFTGDEDRDGDGEAARVFRVRDLCLLLLRWAEEIRVAFVVGAIQNFYI